MTSTTSKKPEQTAPEASNSAAEAPIPVGSPTVGEHAARLPKGDAWKHAAAAAMHGWAEHAHHAGAAFRCSSEDYAAALKAAEAPGKSGRYEPHKPALSEHGARAKRAAR